MTKLQIFVAIAMIGSVAPGVFAQTAPDAGSLLRDQPKAPSIAPVKPIQIAPATPPAGDKETGPRIRVKGFLIQGALLVSEAELQAHLQPVIGREVSFSQLEILGSMITSYYRERGYLARAIFPPQDVKDGVIRLQIIEGKRGSLNIESKGERIDSARVQRFIDSRVGAGQAIDMTRLGEALNVINEQPGLEVRSRMSAGKTEGEVDLVISATEKPLVGINLGANNQGARGTGEYQGTIGLTLANPSGNLDAISLLSNNSQGTAFVRAEYGLAVGDSGLRLGISASDLRYRLTQASFAALQGNGTARTTGLTAGYPLARQNNWNLSLSGGIDDKVLIDHTVAGETGNRHVTVANLGFNGYRTDLSSASVFSFGASLDAGNSDQRNAAALAADRTTRQVQGNFTRLSANAGYLRPVAADLSFNATLRGQFASKNLDSTERMSLGGPSSVRAYSGSDATGDEAWLMTFSLAKKVSDALAASIFLDTGVVTLNRRLWANWNAASPNLPNRYSLSGLGVGLDWRPSPAILVSASLAAPLGSNPGRDANNLNADGSPQHRVRGWLSVSAQF